MNCEHIFLPCLIFIFNSISAKNSTPNDSIWVGGTVVDAITESPIEDADITFMSMDSVIVDEGRPIDWCKKYGIDDGTVLITFNIPVPDTGKYIVKVSSPRYADKYVDIEIPEKEYGKRPEGWEIGNIPLDKSYLSLGEAVIRASKVMMVNKGDTIVYNASAFQLSEGSMLDALIAQLPGVRLTEDGQIYVNEQYVSCLLVNGKDFFKGNPTVALKNLPAYTVDKVKAYKRGEKSDYLFKRDSTERMQDELVLDVALKKEYYASWLANADVGYGTDDRYTARLFGMRFTNRLRVAAFANMNNIGVTQQPGENVEHSVELLPVQPVTEKAGGLDFYAEMGERKISYNSILTASHLDENALTEVASNSTYPDYQFYTRSRTVSRFCRTSAEWRNLLCIPMPKVYTEFTVGGEYGKSSQNTLARSIELDALPYETYRLAALDSVFSQTTSEALSESLINRYKYHAEETVQRYAFAASGLAKWKAPFTGSPISLYTEFAYEKQRTNNTTTYALNCFPASYVLNREQWEKDSWKDWDYKARIDYEYKLPGNFKLKAKYEFGYQRQRSNRTLDTLLAVPDAEVAQLLTADFYNSYDRTLRRISHTPELQLHFASPKWLMSVHFPVRFTDAQFSETRLTAEAARPRKHYVAFEPTLSVNSNKGLAFTYTYQEKEPNMVYLTGLQDTSNPLSIMLGNTALHNRGTHTSSINYSKSNAAKVQNIGMSGSCTITHNDVALQREYDALTGISAYTPRNVNGNYDIQLQSTFSQAIDKQKHFIPEAGIQLNLAQSVGYVGIVGNGNTSLRTTMKSLTLAPQLGIRYQAGGTSLRLTARGEWLHGVSSQEAYENVNTRNMRYSFIASFPVLWGVRLDTDLSFYTKRGYEETSMNTEHLVLNASLSKSILRDKSLTLRLTGFDLFNQLNNIQQSVNAQGRIETWSNTLNRYVMFHLIYRFSKKPKQYGND